MAAIETRNGNPAVAFVRTYGPSGAIILLVAAQTSVRSGSPVASAVIPIILCVWLWIVVAGIVKWKYPLREPHATGARAHTITVSASHGGGYRSSLAILALLSLLLCVTCIVMSIRADLNRASERAETLAKIQANNYELARAVKPNFDASGGDLKDDIRRLTENNKIIAERNRIIANGNRLAASLIAPPARQWFTQMVAPLLILPMFCLLRWHWNRRRAAWRLENHLCSVCAYDLRASPDRCPECGTAIPQEELRTQA